MEEATMRETIQAKLASGHLKSHDGDIMVATTGSGQPCAACDKPIPILARLHGLGRLSVTVLANCSGVGRVGRGPGCRARREQGLAMGPQSSACGGAPGAPGAGFRHSSGHPSPLSDRERSRTVVAPRLPLYAATPDGELDRTT